ncbi:MAG: type II toxin-antitoxin system VapC family toxin [Vicinamibacterales bacterium]
MKYLDASAVLRLLFGEPGVTVSLADGDAAVASELVEVEAFRALDRERLLGRLDDREAARKRKELAEMVEMLDLVPIDRAVIDRAKSAFGVNVRALDAIHVATAEVLAAESGLDVEFWTHDERQGIAAVARGFAVKGL